MIKSTESVYVGSLIAGDVPFVVPKYQRPYAWEEDEIKDFIRDIKELYYGTINDPLKPRKKHFFGGIISIYQETPRPPYYTIRTYEVVDGQQRLATIILTIALLVRGIKRLAFQAEASEDLQLAETAKSHAETLREKYLEYKEVVGNRFQEQLRLKLSSVDAAFFENLIKSQVRDRSNDIAPVKASHKRLQEAWEKLNADLILTIIDNTAIKLEEKLNRFLVLSTSLLEDCYLIHISSDDMGEAYRLFAVLNDRGKALSEGDLLRVYTLEMLETHSIQQSQIERSWDDILGHDYNEVKDFLRAYYTSYKGDSAPSGDFADKFREQFFNYKKGLSFEQAIEVVNHIERMKKEIDIFHEISQGNWPYENSTVSLSERTRLSYLIRALKHTLCLPLLLSAWQGLPEKEFAKLIDLLCRFSFRYINMVSEHAGTLGRTYNKYALALREGRTEHNMSTFQKELLSLQNNKASDKLFEEAMRQKLTYRTSLRNHIRYFLITIEEYLEWYNRGAHGKPIIGNTSRVFDFEKCTLEHIYPQNAASEDPNLKAVMQDIGNISIWGPDENSRVGNRSFADKRTYYQRSPILLNQELAHLPEWNVPTLEERKNKLIEIAVLLFSAAWINA